MTLRACILYERYQGPIRQWRSQLRAQNVDSTKVDGFFAFKREIERELDLVVEHVEADLTSLQSEIEKTRADLVLVVPEWVNWHDAPGALVDSFAELYSSANRPALGLLDLSDPTGSPFMDLLPHVDVFLKSQLLTDRSRYADNLAGGLLVSEWVQDELGFSLGEWSFGKQADPAYLDRLMCGWTMGISRFYRRVAAYADLFAKPLEHRAVDLNRRFGKPDPATSPTWEWYQEYRRFAATRVESLEGFRLGSSAPLSQFAYLRDMMQCRAVFSPFGWGEVCFRDYEAVACGAVLIKPDMSHLECKPDVFEAGETYVPVSWDLSDLAEKMDWIRDAPQEAARIAHAARERLERRCIRDGFIDDLREILTRTGLTNPADS